MPSDRTHVAMPRHIHERLKREAKKLDELRDGGMVEIPAQLMEQGVPLWYVIERLLDFKEAHRARARKPGKRLRLVTEEWC